MVPPLGGCDRRWVVRWWDWRQDARAHWTLLGLRSCTSAITRSALSSFWLHAYYCWSVLELDRLVMSLSEWMRPAIRLLEEILWSMDCAALYFWGIVWMPVGQIQAHCLLRWWQRRCCLFIWAVIWSCVYSSYFSCAYGSEPLIVPIVTVAPCRRWTVPSPRSHRHAYKD